MRLGKYIQASQDIYGLLFVSQCCNTAMNKYFDIIKGELIIENEDDSDSDDE